MLLHAIYTRNVNIWMDMHVSFSLYVLSLPYRWLFTFASLNSVFSPLQYLLRFFFLSPVFPLKHSIFTFPLSCVLPSVVICMFLYILCVLFYFASIITVFVSFLFMRLVFIILYYVNFCLLFMICLLPPSLPPSQRSLSSCFDCIFFVYIFPWNFLSTYILPYVHTHI